MALELWNGRVATQTDANSPLDAPLMDGIRKDLDHLRQVLYGNDEGTETYFTPTWGHRHTGGDSAPIGGGAVDPLTFHMTNFQVLAVGDSVAHNNDGEVTSSDSGNFVKHKEIRLGDLMVNNSAIRIIFNLREGVTTPTVQYGKIYINGSPVGIERSNSSASYITYSEDFASLSPGDTIELWLKGSTAQCNTLSLNVAPIQTAYPDKDHESTLG